MGLLDKVVKNAIGKAVEQGVKQGVQNTVTTKVEQTTANAVNQVTTNAVNQATNSFNQSVSQNTQTQQSSVDNESLNQSLNALGGLFGSMQTSAVNFANEAAKNMKICPNCGEGASAENKFCPSCGSVLPTQTVAQGAVCSSCGKQNNVGQKFCADCGTKLPSAIAEEQAAIAKDAAVLVKWDQLIPQYPKWNFGGKNFSLEIYDDSESIPRYLFCADGVNNSHVQQYRNLCMQNGFVKAGKYPTEDMLYKMIDGQCYYFESCDPFAGDGMCVSFGIEEPSGGFYYKEPEKKKPATLFDLFK